MQNPDLTLTASEQDFRDWARAQTAECERRIAAAVDLAGAMMARASDHGMDDPLVRSWCGERVAIPDAPSLAAGAISFAELKLSIVAECDRKVAVLEATLRAQVEARFAQRGVH